MTYRSRASLLAVALAGLMCISSAGNLYFADSANNVIRAVAAGSILPIRPDLASTTPGDVYLVAGEYAAGYTGDGGPPTSAELNQPQGVFAPSSGQIVILDTFNLGRGSPLGYFGAFLVAGLMSAYVMYGFDTAGSLAEETLDPRKNAPPAILRALAAAGLAGFLLILFGEMATPNIHASQLGTSGLPYLVKATLGGPIGNVFLIDSLIAITVCSLAVHAGGIRMIFTMGRDGRLPFASAIAKVHGKSKTPLVPSLVIGVVTILLLVLNVGNQRAFFVLTSVAIIMFYIAYMCVTGPLLIARLRGKWPTPEHGRYFNLGRWGLPVNLVAVIFQIGVMVNLAWPRVAVYGGDHWYFQWGAFTFTGLLGAVGVIYYFAKLHGRPATALAEHRAGPVPAVVGVADEIA